VRGDNETLFATQASAS